MTWTAILWLLFPAFCECLVLVGIHSYLGLHVLRRKVIFVDLALAQIAALGTLVGFLFGIPLGSTASMGFAVALTAVGAAVFSLSRFRESRIPQEAVIGLAYAVSAALAILLIDKAPHGAEHIKEILTGSLLWVKWTEIGTAAAAYAAVGAFHFAFRRRFILISEDPDRAWSEGTAVRLWDFFFYLSFGVVITISVQTAGVLLVFVFLVAPAIIATVLTDRWVPQLLIGWGLGLVVTFSGLLLSYVADLPTGPAVIGVYAAFMVIISAAVYVVRAPERGKALARTATVALAFTAATALFALAGLALGRHGAHGHGQEHACDGCKMTAPGGVKSHSPGDPANSKTAPQERLACARDDAERLDILTAALKEDLREGTVLALAFLEGDPPEFFRSQAVEALDDALSEPSGLDPGKQFADPVNRDASERLRRSLSSH